jgi:nitrate reductase (cytochrome), electron transfer subunit
MRGEDRATGGDLTMKVICRTRCIAILAALAASTLLAQDLGGLRGRAPLAQEPKAPPLARVENTDIKRGRAYTSQPPTIPHAIDKYEITRNVNFCMYCHARVRNQEFGAPMVSATHYMDRDQNFLAEISPRRYFCTQCHVPQTDAKPPIGNEFIDVHDLIEQQRKRQQSKRDTSKPDPKPAR